MNESQEKKVEYLELIYDLIFVYLIGRNNSLLHNLEGAFVTAEAFWAYLLCTLAVIQIWSYSTHYINIYGRNSVRDHVFLFINMYLLYHMANGIGTGWQSSFYQFCIAWILILVNTGVQYLIEMRRHRDEPWEIQVLKHRSFILFTEAVLVGLHLVIYHHTGVSTTWLPIAFGIAAVALSGRMDMAVPVDFSHLSERIMLYIVFTFGEMIISVTGYFSEEITLNNLYFAGMAFLIAVSLFLSYEVFYNRILDRETITNGAGYMGIHIFLIFALNNISVSLEFMRNTEVALLPKTLFISLSYVLYFGFLFLVCKYAKKQLRFSGRAYALTGVMSAAFVLLMVLLREQMKLNIAVSVLYVFAVFLIMYIHGKERR